MMRTAGELAAYLGGRLEGDAARPLTGVADLDAAGAGDLSYAEPRWLERAAASGASCILVAAGSFPGRTTITVANPKAAFARAAAWLLPPAAPPAGVHPTAVIAPGAVIGPGASVGPYAVVDDGARIGPASAIGPGCHVGRDVTIGQHCRIHARVVLYPDTRLGDRVVVHAGAVIGADGFGFVRDGDAYVKFPQLGRVVIADDVEIGANATIDRGSLGETVIEQGAKLDNLCHVAHNVRVGPHTVIAAQTGISGSCRIGANVVVGGQVGIADHVRVDDGAVIGAQCGVPSGKRLRGGDVFWGTPARLLKDIKVQQAYIARLPKLAQEIERLGARLAELDRKGTPES